jgi:competence protein ComEA
VNRTFVIAAAALVLLLAFWRPARAPAGIVAASPAPLSQQFRKGKTSRAAPAAQVVVYVAGAVARAGVYALPASARVQDAIARAGGLRADADPLAVNLAARVSDGEEIAVPRIGQATPRPARSARRRRVKASPAAIDINTADAAALASLPGVGETLASRIIEYRRLNGPFASLDELLDVAGMTQRRVDALAPYVRMHDAP